MHKCHMAGGRMVGAHGAQHAHHIFHVRFICPLGYFSKVNVKAKGLAAENTTGMPRESALYSSANVLKLP